MRIVFINEGDIMQRIMQKVSTVKRILQFEFIFRGIPPQVVSIDSGFDVESFKGLKVAEEQSARCHAVKVFDELWIIKEKFDVVQKGRILKAIEQTSIEEMIQCVRGAEGEFADLIIKSFEVQTSP